MHVLLLLTRVAYTLPASGCVLLMAGHTPVPLDIIPQCPSGDVFWLEVAVLKDSQEAQTGKRTPGTCPFPLLKPLEELP